jgi:chaperonin GroEL (HSP60 family)
MDYNTKPKEYVKKSLYDNICTNSNIVSGDEYRELVCAIAQVASDMVAKTLGPYGYTTVIDDGSGFTYPSKDGWTCLNKLQFTDPTYNTIFNMLKKISFNSVATVGDGTTTAMVAANNFLKMMYTRFIPGVEEKGGFRQADFVETMNRIYEIIELKLKTNPNIKQVNVGEGYNDIWKIAYVATNGNKHFADIIQTIYQETDNPHIHVSLDKVSETTYEIQKGYKFDARTLNFPLYVNDASGVINNKNHPQRIVIFDHNVTFQSHQMIIGSISQLASRDGSEILILAPYFDDIVTSWIDSSVQNLVKSGKIPNITLIQVPVTMDLHRQTLSDLCVLTNAQIFDDGKVKAFNILHHNQTHKPEEQIKDDILSLENYAFDSPGEIIERCLGTVQSIILSRTEGFLQDYEHIANPIKYKSLMKDAEDNYTAAKTKALKTIGGTLDKEYLFIQMRYIKLKGSTGVVKVGGVSDIQQRCDKDSIDDAVLACRSAFENGYVRGMNLELLKVINELYREYDEVIIKEVYEHQLTAAEAMNRIAPFPYYFDILNMLYSCIYNTSLQVIRNKRPSDSEHQRITTFTSETDEKERYPVVFNITNTEILDILVDDKEMYDYDLRTETFNARKHWKVVNSTATDIEILRAIVSVLTIVITSNQFLSMTRRFDSRVNDEKELERRVSEETALTKSKATAVIDILNSCGLLEKPLSSDKIRELFTKD